MTRIRRVPDGGGLGMLVAESMTALAVASALCYAHNQGIYRALKSALPNGHRQLLVFSPGEATANAVRIAVLSGIVLCMPVVAYRLSAYAVRTNGPLDPALVAVPLACLLGLVLGWLLVVPLTLNELTGFDHPSAQFLPRARDYIEITLGSLIASGAGGAGLAGWSAARRAA